MSSVVQKYGGTSVAGPERIRARRARGSSSTRGRGRRASASSSRRWATRPTSCSSSRRRSRRARIRASATCCSRPASRSRSRSSRWRSTTSAARPSRSPARRPGIVTDTTHGRARIVAMRSDRVREALDAGRIAIVAGFQGVSTTLDVTTLGRGGSDTTAVALAAALGADVCEIYTDVDGVFTADPRIVPEARKLDTVTYEEMLDLAACGAKVLMLRSVEYARNHGVPLHVRSSFSRRRGHARREPGGVARARDHLRNRARHVGGEGDDPRRARPAGHRGARLPAARRRRRERRHDRAERLGRGPHRHLVHAAEGRRPGRGARSCARSPARSTRPASRATPTSRRSR